MTAGALDLASLADAAFVAALPLAIVGWVRAARRPPPLRRCIGCGCTDERACPGGCRWASLTPPICSRCAE